MSMEYGKLNIALTFSGGGYRAAAFNLGVLTYLNCVQIQNRSFLEHVTVLSTVSGGTITGAIYSISLKMGKDMNQVFNKLYSFMANENLVSLALERLISNKGWDENRTKSLINAIADIYDAYLFDNAKFGLLLSNEPEIHLKHISFNATEFANALQFRFQCSEKIKNPKVGEPEFGVIGNYHYRLPASIAQYFRMADILAASSCFPGGFEPINFPSDFILPPHLEIQNLKKEPQYPVGLMDGGIVDNQGIEPVLLAEKRIKRNQESENGTINEEKAIDLIIVSDVASPYMDDYKSSKQNTKGIWRKLTPTFIFSVNSFVLLVSAFFVYFNSMRSPIWLIVSVIIFTLSVSFFVLVRIIKSLPKRMHVPSAFLKPFSKLLNLKLGVYENLLTNRLDSMLKLTNDVFLKHIRRLNYKIIFNDAAWQNRRIMNAIYEINDSSGRIENKVKGGAISDNLIPSASMQKVSKRASEMGTTLWFTNEDLKNDSVTGYNMLDTIIACGQFTICWNLLEYIEKIKKDASNTNEKHQLITDCESQLLTHWNNFKEDPYWLLSQFKKSMR